MSNNTLVTITSSDLNTVTGAGQLLTSGQSTRVLSTLGHNEQSVLGVVKTYNLTPGQTFANGASLGAQNSFRVLNALRPF